MRKKKDLCVNSRDIKPSLGLQIKILNQNNHGKSKRQVTTTTLYIYENYSFNANLLIRDNEQRLLFPQGVGLSMINTM